MAMIECSECGAPISNKAAACPRCGCPTGSSGTGGAPVMRRRSRWGLALLAGVSVVLAVGVASAWRMGLFGAVDAASAAPTVSATAGGQPDPAQAQTQAASITAAPASGAAAVDDMPVVAPEDEARWKSAAEAYPQARADADAAARDLAAAEANDAAMRTSAAAANSALTTFKMSAPLPGASATPAQRALGDAMARQLTPENGHLDCAAGSAAVEAAIQAAANEAGSALSGDEAASVAYGSGDVDRLTPKATRLWNGSAGVNEVISQCANATYRDRLQFALTQGVAQLCEAIESAQPSAVPTRQWSADVKSACDNMQALAPSHKVAVGARTTGALITWFSIETRRIELQARERLSAQRAEAAAASARLVAEKRLAAQSAAQRAAALKIETDQYVQLLADRAAVLAKRAAIAQEKRRKTLEAANRQRQAAQAVATSERARAEGFASTGSTTRMSEQDIQTCMMTANVIAKIAAQKAQFMGAQAASDWAAEEIGRKTSPACQAYVAREWQS